MDIVLVAGAPASTDLKARLTAAGSPPTITSCTLPASLPAEALIVAAVPTDELAQLCAAVRGIAPVLALVDSQDPCVATAAIDAGADDCCWSGADAAALATRLAVLSRRRSKAAGQARAETDYQAIVEGTFDGLFILDITADGDFSTRFVNRRYEGILGQSNAEVAGTLVRDVVAPERYAIISERYRQVASSGQPLTVEESVVSPTGSFVVQTLLSPLLDQSGRCYGIVGSTRDITAAKEAERAQFRAEERLAAAVDQAPILLSTFDAEGNYTFSRGAALKLVGRASDEKVGAHYSEFYTAGRAPRLALERALAGEATSLDAVLATGESLHLTYRPWLSPEGERLGAMVVGIDVTARVRAEEARLQTEANYRAVVEGTSDGIYVMERGEDGQFRCTVVNEAYQRLFERPAHVVIGKTLEEALPADNAARVASRYADAIAARAPIEWEATFPVSDGKRTLVIHITPLFDENGECYRIIGSMRDVTAGKAAEEARRNAEQFLRTLVDKSPIIVLALDADGRFTFTAGAAVESLGLPPERAVGRSALNLYRNIPEVVAAIEGALSGHATTVELDGNGRTWDAHYTALFDSDGNVTGAIGVILDVTDRKRAEATLLTERAFTDATIDSLPGVFYLFTSQGKFLKTNARFRQVSGYSSADVADMHPLQFFGSEDRELVRERIGQVFARGEARVEAGFVSKDGTSRPYFFTGKLIQFGGEACLVGMGIDVSESKAAEEAVRRAAADLGAVFDSVRDQITLVGLDRRVLSFNPAAARAALAVTGHDMEAGDDMNEYVLDSDRAAFMQHFEEALEGQSTSTEGSVEVDGRMLWYERVYSPVRLEDGSIRGVAVVARNVTSRKRSEEALRESQKLESLGILAGGIAHDFNNLLVGILGNAGLALEEVSPSSPVHATLEDIETAGRRAADLARQMLAYSGKGRFVIQLVDLRELVPEMMHLLRVSIGKRVVLNTSFAAGLPPVEADATQLRQVVMNLVVNASDAIGDADGAISVSTALVHVDRAYLDDAYLAPDLPEGDYVSLEVTDTGSGMDQRTLARIFDPFFTTKFTGRGLGLAAVLGIVRGHRGAIKVTSEPGEGTTFRLLLPAAEGSVATANTDAPQKWTGHGTVLLVDDEPTVRAVTARALSSFGFDVLEAGDGQDGVEQFTANADGIVCVLLDMTMPRLNGEQAFLAIKAIRPDVPVVLMSGYSEQEAMSHFAAQGLAGFVQKPYSVQTLRETVRGAITGE